MKRILIICIAVILALGCVTACSNVDSGPTQLWVVTEVTPSTGMNAQIRYYMEQFQSEHPNVTIHLDILPTVADERTEYIRELYKKIESGEGPDIYLLPDSDLLKNDQTYIRATPLFPDIELAMRAGIFADISRLYDFDFSLGKSALQNTVMDAGVVGGSRYVLPLRYDIRTVYYFPDRISGSTELDIENCTISDLMQYVIDIGNPAIASGVDNIVSRAHYTLIESFSNLIDYNSGEVTMTAQDLKEYFSIYQKLCETIGPDKTEYGGVYLHNVEEIVDFTPIKVSSLVSAIPFSAYAKHTGSTLKMAPLRTDDGDVIATVSYFGAVGSGCKNTETAYEFLRQFLSEEAQWKTTYLEDSVDRIPPLSGYGWPVRVKGAAPYLWNTAQLQLERHDESLYQSGYQSIELSDQDIPVPETEIDIVRFHFLNNFYQHWIQLNDYNNHAAPTDVDIEALSNAFIQDLKITYNSNLNSLP